MRHCGLLLSIGLSALAMGCGDDGSAGEGGTESSGSDTGTGGMTTASMTTASMTTASMTTADGSSTGEPPPGTSDDGATMTPADSTTGEEPTGGSTEPPADSGSGSSSGGGNGDAAYPPCDLKGDPVCPEPYENCYDFAAPDYTACTVPCEGFPASPDNCPQPTSGDAVPVCGGQAMDTCILDCSGGEQCPDNMECVEIIPGVISRCLWPA